MTGVARLIILLLVISKLPAILLTPVPVTVSTPPVVKLAPVTLPDAVIVVATTVVAPKLPTLALPVTDRTPPVLILPAVALPLADKLPTLAFCVTAKLRLTK